MTKTTILKVFNMSVNDSTPISVGMLATYHIGSDRYSGTISEVKRKGRTLVFKFAHSGRTEEFTLRQGGMYYGKGSNCGYLSLGVAVDYRDPSF